MILTKIEVYERAIEAVTAGKFKAGITYLTEEADGTCTGCAVGALSHAVGRHARVTGSDIRHWLASYTTFTYGELIDIEAEFEGTTPRTGVVGCRPLPLLQFLQKKLAEEQCKVEQQRASELVAV